MQSMQTTSGYVNQSCSCELRGRVPWIQVFLFFLLSQLFLFVFVLLDILCGLLCGLMEARIVHIVKSQKYCDLGGSRRFRCIRNILIGVSSHTVNKGMLVVHRRVVKFQEV